MTATVEDIQATQEFAIFNVLCGHCGQRLTADNVDKIMTEILHEMRDGPCAWAFSQEKETADKRP